MGEWRIFFKDSAGTREGIAALLSRTSTREEERTDQYVLGLTSLGLKLRHGEKLELKVRVKSTEEEKGLGIEYWKKKKFGKESLTLPMHDILAHVRSKGYADAKLEKYHEQLRAGEVITVKKHRCKNSQMEVTFLTIEAPSVHPMELNTVALPADTPMCWISIAVEVLDIAQFLCTDAALALFLHQHSSEILLASYPTWLQSLTKKGLKGHKQQAADMHLQTVMHMTLPLLTQVTPTPISCNSDSANKAGVVPAVPATERTVFRLHQFALVICRNPFQESPSYNHWLAVDESRDRGWWLPGGAVDRGETFAMAATRECLEEAGIQVELKGLLKVDYRLVGGEGGGDSARMRVVYYAEPVSLQQAHSLKKVPDQESNGAKWVTVHDLSTSPMVGQGRAE